jgi:hypothetical protein
MFKDEMFLQLSLMEVYFWIFKKIDPLFEMDIFNSKAKGLISSKNSCVLTLKPN